MKRSGRVRTKDSKNNQNHCNANGVEISSGEARRFLVHKNDLDKYCDVKHRVLLNAVNG